MEDRFANLDDAMIHEITLHLSDYNSVLHLRMTCKRMHEIITGENLWQRLNDLHWSFSWELHNTTIYTSLPGFQVNVFCWEKLYDRIQAAINAGLSIQWLYNPITGVRAVDMICKTKELTSGQLIALPIVPRNMCDDCEAIDWIDTDIDNGALNFTRETLMFMQPVILPLTPSDMTSLNRVHPLMQFHRLGLKVNTYRLRAHLDLADLCTCGESCYHTNNNILAGFLNNLKRYKNIVNKDLSFTGTHNLAFTDFLHCLPTKKRNMEIRELITKFFVRIANITGEFPSKTATKFLQLGFAPVIDMNRMGQLIDDVYIMLGFMRDRLKPTGWHKFISAGATAQDVVLSEFTSQYKLVKKW